MRSDVKGLANKPREFKEALANMLSQEWRLNNLYYILNDEGFKVPFIMNEAQRWLYENKHYWNLVLKGRQIGFTTFIDLYILDTALFTPNIECAIIAHTREDAAKILRRKIKYPYSQLPDAIKKRVRLKKDSESEVIFTNGKEDSVISVSTSVRSGTLQILHISEFAKVCAKFPDKATEIVTGSIETLAPGQELFIESTAEGREGQFFDFCKVAQDRVRLQNYPLNPQEFKLNFFGWHVKPSNRIPVEYHHVLPQEKQAYFNKLEEEHGLKLDDEQKFWYVNKEKLLGDKMKREHPSTIDEAFEETIEGTYFSKEFRRVREEKRLCSVPVQDGYEVHTAWDIGVNDMTTIWFFQTVGKELRVVDYYENNDEGLLFYRDVLWEKGYRYGKHLAPHDIQVKELGTGKTRLETAQNVGINFIVVPRTPAKADAIQAVRNILGVCWFDEERCSEGVKKLELYRKEWDDRHGIWKNKPRHDENSHTADAFMTLAQGYDIVSVKKIVRPTKVDHKRRWLAHVAG